MFNIYLSIEETQLLGRLEVDSYFFDVSLYQYAYYLYKDGQRVNSKWYSDSMVVTFDIKEPSGQFYIKVFVKDKRDNHVRTFNSNKLYL